MLPKSTEVNKPLPKKAIYKKLLLNTEQKTKFDSDISKIFIVNEVSEQTMNIAKGTNISSFFVLKVVLKSKSIKENNITMLSKLIPQNIVYLLEYENEYSFAIYHTRLIRSAWSEELFLPINGINLEIVWENIVKYISGGEFTEDLTLEENLEQHIQDEKTLLQVQKLEKKLKTTKQFNQKVKIKQEIERLKGVR